MELGQVFAIKEWLLTIHPSRNPPNSLPTYKSPHSSVVANGSSVLMLRGVARLEEGPGQDVQVRSRQRHFHGRRCRGGAGSLQKESSLVTREPVQSTDSASSRWMFSCVLQAFKAFSKPFSSCKGCCYFGAMLK